MEVIEILGYKRANLGKVNSRKLRSEAYVPGVIYGGQEQVHFSLPMFFLKDIVYTSKVYFVDLNIEGKVYRSILQDVQFHPVSEMILHVDFLEILDNKKIKMSIPLSFVGNSVGVAKGGILAKKERSLWVCAYPKDMPSYIEVDVSELDLGKIVRVSQVKGGDYTILAPPSTPLASIDIPRALRSAEAKQKAK